ncbi:uroporphyrinogen decarboxylase family protein [Treponema socranskii]|uniref:Uroporphyrinogen decarboxylase n=1 Tax=Treponema socranskii subsp. socranskii VPI DR56BR1116 = ATCC 35536 TaxID=1125725 RepID=U1FJT8_TRESO|nr:uroporphyrinogen decarboxylase family protein [Treponema socranskii]ERF59611.1 uroporphyrinogen decarboxylase [Treponema socranskii subsp. socranskii VPI DR56BR1116 = ATCC 35536]ERJ98599.1 uroporphyrinogen decarboxylase [Treponema socranskii subsp. socranskii VPI DR56BR1116 = ATCC 35536]
MKEKKKLILDAFDNKAVNRVPVGFWWHFADEYRQFRGLMDEGIVQATIDGTKKLYDDLKPDMVKIMSDGFFGHPSIMENDINTIDDIKKIKSIGASSPWYDKQVDMINEILKHFDGEIAAFYNIFAPFNYIRLYTECYKKRPELFVQLFNEDPEAMLAASLEIAKDVSVLADKIKKNTSVDGIYYSVQSVQSEKADLNFHKRYVMESDLQGLNAINKLWDNNILHICGYGSSTNDLSFYKEYKAKVYNWAVYTEKVPLSEGKKFFGGACVLGGFANSKGTMLDIGSDAEIENRVKEIIADAGSVGVIIGADCTVPPQVGYKRLDEVRKYAEKYSKR